jgi:prepilin-type N-terminal cleavage/methylation domain-containing protein/prepilin-type processing-associated H-X9-DG protein
MVASGFGGRLARRGFTIIELLVVMAVISILLGIILPVLPKVRDSARRVGCGSNQRQIGISMETYKGDDKQKYPTARYMPDPWITQLDEVDSLNKAMRNYIEPDSEVYHCPGDSEVFDVEYTDEDGDIAKGGSSYKFTTALSGRTFEESWFHARLNWQPTEHPVLQDYDGTDLEYHTSEPDGETAIVNPGFFHRARNILFVDGHVGGLD